MTKKRPRANDFADLRRRAEEMVHTDDAQVQKPLSPKESGRLLHELQVHQIELEMQNEELRRAQGELEAARARYFDLFDLAPVGYFTLSEQADPGSKPHSGWVARGGETRSGQEAVDTLHPSGRPGRLLPASQAAL